MLRGHKSRPHCHDTVLRYAVTLQVLPTFSLLKNKYVYIMFCGQIHAPATLPN